jgi:hypothetical protein
VPPVGKRRRNLDEEGSGQNRQDGRGDKGLKDIPGKEAVGPPDAGQDKGEFSDLGERQPRDKGYPRPIPEESDRQDHDQGLEHNDENNQAGDE